MEAATMTGRERMSALRDERDELNADLPGLYAELAKLRVAD